jgi:hypothetical protein
LEYDLKNIKANPMALKLTDEVETQLAGPQNGPRASWRPVISSGLQLFCWE